MNKRKALISLSDKTGAAELARALHAFGIDILSTGGTAKLLREANVPVVEIGDYTGFPEMLDGRVKTLHPKIHGGLLGRRDDSSHLAPEILGSRFTNCIVVQRSSGWQKLHRPVCNDKVFPLHLGTMSDHVRPNVAQRR